jgi:hypothetical protein
MSKDFEAMKAGKLAIWPWLTSQYKVCLVKKDTTF